MYGLIGTLWITDQPINPNNYKAGLFKWRHKRLRVEAPDFRHTLDRRITNTLDDWYYMHARNCVRLR